MLPFSSFLFPERSWSFQASYKCFSVSMLPGNQRLDVEKGGKIILPPSALETLTHLHVSYPMLFKLTNEAKQHTSHAGVLEFIADEGKCYLPHWLMNNLQLDEEDNVTIESASLPVATFSKFQPLNSDFLDITNPKAVLENALRNFACLTTGDVIAIQYNEKIYELCVLQTRPGNAVNIIECDMNVEFEAPADYESPSKLKIQDEPTDTMAERGAGATDYEPTFEGSGVRLDGKQKKPEQLAVPQAKKFNARRGIPDFDYSFGVLKFDRSSKPISDRVKKTEEAGEEKENGKAKVDPDGGVGGSGGGFQGKGLSIN